MDIIASAIADPTRRDILLMLRASPQTAGVIAGAFTVTRPAISRHLRVLRNAGLVVDTVDGRERIYRLELMPLAAVEDFITALRRDTAAAWEHRMMALDTEVHRIKRKAKQHKKTEKRA